MSSIGSRVAIVGLGTAGGFALRALDTLGIPIAVGVDPRGLAAPAAGLLLEKSKPVAHTLAALREVPCDTVIVSAATSAHREVLEDLFGSPPMGLRRVWCEKPMVDRLATAEQLWKVGDQQGIELRTLLHTAFSREVLWAVGVMRDLRATHGLPVALRCRFCDPYSRERERRRASLGGSWLDSGVNALSVALRFYTHLAVCEASGETPDHGWARMRFRDDESRGTLEIFTSWDSIDDHKETSITFADGAALQLNHSAGEALLKGPDGLPKMHRTFGKPPLWQRYREMLAIYLANGRGLLIERAHERVMYDCLGSVAETIGESA